MLGRVDVPALGEIETSPVDLVFESRLNAARKWLRLLLLRDVHRLRDGAPHFFGTAGAAECRQGVNHRSDKLNEFRCRVALFCHRSQSEKESFR